MKISFSRLFSCLAVCVVFQGSATSLNFKQINERIEDCYKQTELSQQGQQKHNGSVESCTTLTENRFIPKHIKAVAFFNRGVIYHYLGQEEKAIADIQVANELQPDLAEAHIALSSLFFQTKQVGSSLVHLDKAIELIGQRQDLQKFRQAIQTYKSRLLSEPEQVVLEHKNVE